MKSVGRDLRGPKSSQNAMTGTEVFFRVADIHCYLLSGFPWLEFGRYHYYRSWLDASDSYCWPRSLPYDGEKETSNTRNIFTQ